MQNSACRSLLSRALMIPLGLGLLIGLGFLNSSTARAARKGVPHRPLSAAAENRSQADTGSDLSAICGPLPLVLSMKPAASKQTLSEKP